MKTSIATAGNLGKKVRSDCHISLEIKAEGGHQIDIESKVNVMFGDSNKALISDILKHFGVEHAHVVVKDAGALPFVLAARLEACIKKLQDSKASYLPDALDENSAATAKDKQRFSRLYLPGNTPSMMLNAGLHQPNGLILDLEDAVAVDKKHEARFVVRNALRALRFYGAERMVRINQGARGLEDLEYIVPHHVNTILVPKVEAPEQLIAIQAAIDNIQRAHNHTQPIWLMPIIESAKGVMNAYAIAQATDTICAMAIGLEDYTADMGVRRTQEATESFFARCMLSNAAVAAGIQAIDSVYSDVSNMEGLAVNVQASKGLGFSGMGCIHPRQIKVIHENFAPAEAEIEKAKRIYKAFVEAKAKGLGVVSLGTKMIDAPVVKRAEKLIKLAIDTHKLDANWLEEEI